MGLCGLPQGHCGLVTVREMESPRSFEEGNDMI